MEKHITILIDIIKKQAQSFLLAMDGEFFPFGTYINKNNEVKPFSVYSETEKPPSTELIESMNDYVQKLLEADKCKVAGITINVTIKEKGESFDAIEIRFYEIDKVPYKKYFKYYVHADTVEFLQHTFIQ